jgi:two-component system, response regulator PdtaR
MAAPSIFIVEDEAIVANDIRETLKVLGYGVSGIAKSGAVAIERVKETRPDLVLMDIRLDGRMDGIETAGQIRSSFDIPVIYLTAHADTDLLERAKITEPYGYVLKPYDERELLSNIRIALYKHTVEREIRKRDAILFALSSAVEWLLRTSRPKSGRKTVVSEIDASTIRDVLEQMGIAVGASTIKIFTIEPDAAQSFSVGLKYEWTGPEISPAVYKEELKRFSLSPPSLDRWQESFYRGEVILISADESSLQEQRFLSLLGVRSGILLPIIIQDNVWGILGFFSTAERHWSIEEIEALRVTANLFGAALG